MSQMIMIYFLHQEITEPLRADENINFCKSNKSQWLLQKKFDFYQFSTE